MFTNTGGRAVSATDSSGNAYGFTTNYMSGSDAITARGLMYGVQNSGQGYDDWAAAGGSRSAWSHPLVQMAMAAGGEAILAMRGAFATNRSSSQDVLYNAAVQLFKNSDLSNAGRALTKHPEVIGLTKETFRQMLRTDAAINEAAHAALRGIMRNGVTTTPTLGRYGTVTQTQIPGGFGARWASDGRFIGFINP